MNGKKKALKKIVSWWKNTKISTKERSQKNIHNYFDALIKNQDSKFLSNNEVYKNLNDFRMLEKITDCNLALKVPLILTIEKVR